MERSPIPELDSDFQFLDLTSGVDSDFKYFTPEKPAPERRFNRLKPKDRVFLARLGVAALTASLMAAPIASRRQSPESTAIESEALPEPPGPLGVGMQVIPTIAEDEPVTPEELDNPAPPISNTTSSEPEHHQTWDGPILNAYDGRIDGPSGEETFYNLPMKRVVENMHKMGVEGEYWVRGDGAKMLGDYVIVSANLKKYPRGTIVETSLGPGIVCDTGGFVEEFPDRLDIATNW